MTEVRPVDAIDREIKALQDERAELVVKEAKAALRMAIDNWQALLWQNKYTCSDDEGTDSRLRDALLRAQANLIAVRTTRDTP